MVRQIAVWALLIVLPAGCGPDKPLCSGTPANFVVTLRLRDRPLPADTVVHVTYGGSSMEEYSLAAPHGLHKVIFCDPADASGQPLDASLAAAGAGAASEEPSAVEALRCQLWTGGFTTLSVRGSGLLPDDHELTPNERQCTVQRSIVLDSPDGG